MSIKARKAFWEIALGDNSKLANLAKEAIAEAERQILSEREECAKVCEAATIATEQAKEQLTSEEMIGKAVASGAIHQSKKLAAAIRARSNHE